MDSHSLHPSKTVDAEHDHPQPWLRRLEEWVWGPAKEKGATRRFSPFVQRWLQIFDRAIRGFVMHKGPAMASSLTYTSILTIVPLLALALAILKGFDVHQAARETLKEIPFIREMRIYLGPRQPPPPPPGGAAQKGVLRPGESQTGPQAEPGSTPAGGEILTGPQIIDQIYEFVEKTSNVGFGFIGMLGLFWAAMAFLSKMEKSMNEAWAVRRARPWSRRVADYLNMLVFSLLLLAALSATATGSLFFRYSTFWGSIGVSEDYFNAAHRFFLRVIPYLIVWVAFILMYFYIPNTRVRWRSAIISGLIAGTIFQVTQIIFLRFQFLAGRYKIYGAFAILLILLIWLYVSWCIVLLGAEVCSAHQNLRDWRRRRRAWGGTNAERETLALRLAALLAVPMLCGEGGKRMDISELADALMLPPGPVSEMVELFQSHGLVVQTAEEGAYMLARSPESLSVLDILRLVRQGELKHSPVKRGFLNSVSRELMQPLQAKTVKDLANLPLDEVRTFVF